MYWDVWTKTVNVHIPFRVWHDYMSYLYSYNSYIPPKTNDLIDQTIFSKLDATNWHTKQFIMRLDHVLLRIECS